MPFRSEAQRRLVYARAAEGEAWAIRFLKDMGLKPPGVREMAAARLKKKGRN